MQSPLDFKTKKKHYSAMRAFKVIARNPITRNLVMRKMVEKGYEQPSGHKVSELNKRWPAKDFPVVFCFNDSPILGGPGIDLVPEPSESYERAYNIKAELVSLKGIDSIPRADEPELPPAPKPVAKANKLGFTPAFVFPPAAKYSITYAKRDGTVKKYTISNPLEIGDTNFTAYAYGRGVRSFNKDRVLTFEKCG